ncbi:MAG: group II intron maturase-specific domain-containing protein [Acidimicrobiales bacterium]
MRGWSAYYRGVVATETFQKLDHHLWQLTYRWALFRHPNKRKRERGTTCAAAGGATCAAHRFTIGCYAAAIAVCGLPHASQKRAEAPTDAPHCSQNATSLIAGVDVSVATVRSRPPPGPRRAVGAWS